MAKINYSDLLQSPKWQKKRLDVLNLRGFKCEECGNEDKQLHVHHSRYIKGRKPWEYDNDIFMVLCCDCHDKIHSQVKEKQVVEVIPQKYKELVGNINQIESKGMRGDLVGDLSDFVNHFTYDVSFDIYEVLSNLSYALNRRGLLAEIIRNIQLRQDVDFNDIYISQLKQKVEFIESILSKNNLLPEPKEDKLPF